VLRNCPHPLLDAREPAPDLSGGGIMN